MTGIEAQEFEQYYDMVRHQHEIRDSMFKWYISISVFAFAAFGYVLQEPCAATMGMRLAVGVLLSFTAAIGVIVYIFIFRLYVIRDGYLEAIWKLKLDVYPETEFSQTERYSVLKSLEQAAKRPKYRSTRYIFSYLVAFDAFIAVLGLIYLITMG